MLNKLYITPRQWLHVLRWSSYAALLVVAMMLQTVVFGNRTLLGTHPDFVPVVITCVCLREGAERGGTFALLGTLFWALSGADRGALYILVVTVLPMVGSLLSRSVLSRGFLSGFLCCGLTLWVLHSIIFVIVYFYEAAEGSLYFSRVLPCVLVSLLTYPLFYWLVKCIEKIGEPYESI